MTMRVILRADIAGLGKRGDICEIKDGYGRNYLLPRSLALVATDGAVEQAKAMRRARDLRDAADRESAQEIARVLVSRTITIVAKSGAEGRLYGSVTTGDVTEAIAAQTSIELDKRKVSGDPIKVLGMHSVTVKLHSDVQFPVNVEVVSK
jgi:large subunit ribosomal protein L9